MLLLQKGIYPYEYMHGWQKLNKTSLPEKKKDFYSDLNVEDISHADYAQGKWVCKKFWNKCSKLHIIISRSIWKLSKYVSWNI